MLKKFVNEMYKEYNEWLTGVGSRIDRILHL